MTRAEALAEARKRWGSEAIIFNQGRVYLLAPSGSFEGNPRSGWGRSWEAAFADADRRERGRS